MFNVGDRGSSSEIVPVPTYSFAFSARDILLQNESPTDTYVNILNDNISWPIAISFVSQLGEGLNSF